MASRASSDVVVRFIGDTGSLDKGLNNLSGRFQAVTTSLQGIATAGAVVGAISFFKGAIEEAEEAERITRKTAAVLKSTGGAANVTAGQISDLAGTLSELAAVDDEVIQQGQNVLLTFTQIRNEAGKGNDIFNQASLAALDMAAALDKTGDTGAAYQENVIRLGKALNDPIAGLTALKKVGVSFTADQKTMIETMVASGDTMGAQKVILAELNREFGGMAEANATASGKAAVAWGNFAETVGGFVLPAVHAVGEWLNETGIPKLEQFAGVVADAAVPAVRALGDVGGGLADAWNGLPGPLQAGAVALGAWMLVGDSVTGLFSRMSGGARGLGDDVRTAMGAFDVNRVTGTFMALEERIPVVAAMGAAFRENASQSIALGGAWGGLQGRAIQLGATVQGTLAASFVGLKAAGSGLLSVLGGPWGLAVAGGAAILGVFSAQSSKAAASQAALEGQARSVAHAIAEEGKATDAAVRAKAADALINAEVLGGQHNLLAMGKQLGISASDLTSAYLGNADAMDRVREVTDQYVNEDGSLKLNNEKGRSAFTLVGGLNQITAETEKQIAAEKLKTEAVAAGTTVDAAAIAVAKERFESITDEASATEQYKTAVQDLNTALKEHWDLQQGTVEAQESWEANWDSLTESVQRNGTSLDVTAAAGRGNRDALEALVLASQQMVQQDIAAQVPMDEVTRRHNDRITAVVEEARRLGLNKQETEALITAYGGVPDSVSTNIMQTGYDTVNQALLALGAVQMLLQKGDPITPDAIAKQVAANETWARHSAYFNRRATGGLIEGPGTGTSDTAGLFRLSNREFVQRRAAVDYYGVDFMEALNSRRIPREAFPGFARGGLVAPFSVDVSKTKIPSIAEVEAAFIAKHPEAGRIGKMQSWAKQQAGKLYQWGAVGPNNYDCSGLVGNLYAIAKGLPMYRRYFTTAGMGPGRFGMEPGRGRFTVYLGPGHTAANIGGLHVEAYGGNGVPLAVGRVGTPLSYYNQVMHLAGMAQGGLVRLKSDPDARRQSFLERGWPEPGRVGMFRNGGWLEPGMFAYNETNKPEPVLSSEQWKALSKPSVHKTMNVNLEVRNHPVDVMQQLRLAEMMANF